MGQKTGGWIDFSFFTDAWAEFTYNPERIQKKLAKARGKCRLAWRNCRGREVMKWEKRIEELERRLK